MHHNIFTITLNPAVDKSSTVSQIQPEKKLRCSSPNYDPGGGGINVARGLVRLGLQSTAFFPSGGRTGAHLESLLLKEGVDIMPFSIVNDTRENFVVLDTSNNQQFRFGMPGAILASDELTQISDSINSLSPFPKLVVISGSLPPEVNPGFLRHLVKTIKSKSARVIVDTSGAALREVVSEGVFLLKPNLGELSTLTGVEALDNKSTEEAAKQLIIAGKAEVIVVSMGPQGAILVTCDNSLHIHAPTVKKLSTVGAGDSMVAGMVSILAKGGSLENMVRMGVACGTAATMKSGTTLFNKQDADRLYEWLREAVSS
ncbi:MULTISPECIES: 1-phosphofructokinase family hexose kinase [Sphingobacterium]|uniref:1-phosphofructokinase family hexose kinase n=1 Tax=Sphingobacterium TaxID=28453 RepID=UPI0013DBE9CD|nr:MULTISPECIES: hexose kinase [unclassified Sphingobacterium]